MNRFMFWKKRINPGRRIVLGFATLILIGVLLLMLPISTKERVVTPFLTALFTATSATCVTGLTLINVGEYLSVFGQAVMLVLIQFGGLGFMTIFCFIFLISNKQIGLRNRMLIAQSMGTESLEGVVKLVKHVLCITAVFEVIGAAILSLRFIPRYGLIKGIWASVFHSVSAFCNAGFDIIGDGMSVLSYKNDPIVLCTLAFLIIIGGLGFIVWEDVIKKKSWKKLTTYSKVVLLATMLCLVFGTIAFYILEFNNKSTMGDFNWWQRLLSSFFQSSTTRTAGYDAIIQNNLTEPSKIVGIVLMMIGGASGSTAGGVKIGTVAIVFLTLRNVLKSRSDVIIFGRRVGHGAILNAMTLFILWIVLTVFATLMIGVVDNTSALNTLYEVASAYSTVGLSVGITENASVFTQILLIIYMFFGRVGIMTLSVVFMTRAKKIKEIRYPEANMIIG